MDAAIANVEQANAWDGEEGNRWAQDFDHYDASVRAYHDLLLDVAAIGEGDVVLDVGCGCGQTTRDAARRARRGRALGVDLSGPMLARARREAEREGLTNVTFEQGDAQVHPFTPAFDVVMSRNGAMFFADMEAAWRNIGRAVRATGRLALMGWSGPGNNEWIRVLRDAVAMGRDLPLPAPGAPGPFGLGDQARTVSWLRAGGFTGIEITVRAEPFFAGRDADDAFAFVRRVMFVTNALAPLDDGERAEALERLRKALEAHETADGVLFQSEALFVTGRKA